MTVNDAIIDHIRQIRKKEYSRLQDCKVTSHDDKITFHVSSEFQITVIPGKKEWVNIAFDKSSIDLMFESDVDIREVRVLGKYAESDSVKTFVNQVIEGLHRTTSPVRIVGF